MRKSSRALSRLALMTVAAVAALGALTPVSPATAATPAAGVVTIGGKCLDDSDFGTANGNIIQVFDCNGS